MHTPVGGVHIPFGGPKGLPEGYFKKKKNTMHSPKGGHMHTEGVHSRDEGVVLQLTLA